MPAVWAQPAAPVLVNPVPGQYVGIVPWSPQNGTFANLGVRHCQNLASCDKFYSDSPDYQFRIIEALNDDPSCITLQPENYFFDSLGLLGAANVQRFPVSLPNSIAIVSITGTSGQPQVPANDVSWRLIPGIENASLWSLELQTSDPTYEGWVLTLSSSAATVSCSYNNPYGALVVAPPNSPTAGNGSTVSQTFGFFSVPVTATVSWTTEHHDAQNSGCSGWDGPGETAQVCHQQLIKNAPPSSSSSSSSLGGATTGTGAAAVSAVGATSIGGVRLLQSGSGARARATAASSGGGSGSGGTFLSSGVTSTTDFGAWWFGGDSSDTLYLLEDLLVPVPGAGGVGNDDESWQTWSLNLTSLLNITTPATPYGIVGAPAAYAQASTGGPAANMVYVASADGWVAAINTIGCFSQATFPSATSTSTSSSSSSSSRHRAAAAELVHVPAGERAALRGNRRAAASQESITNPLASPEDKWLRSPSPSSSSSSSVSGAGYSAVTGPNGRQWVVYPNLNAVQAAQPVYPYAVNGTYNTWPECQAACWANASATGGAPYGCEVWVWHDPLVAPEYALQCWFKMTPGFVAHTETDHFSGFLATTTPGVTCVQWARQISATNKPSYSPVRLITYNGQQLLLVSETDPNLDTGGVLHGYNAATGVEVFTYAAVYNSASVGLKGVVPAQLPQAQNILLLAYGPQLVAIDLNACTTTACPEVTTWSNIGQPAAGGDAFVTSPVVLPKTGDAVFLHSATGTLWRINIAYNAGAQPPVTFSYAWACQYSRDANSVCNVPSAVTTRVTYDDEYEHVDTASYGGQAGGWYQPTTREERDELHATIRSLHAQLYGAAGTEPVTEAEARDPVTLVARLARELPPHQLFSIITPSGYRRLGANGQPSVEYTAAAGGGGGGGGGPAGTFPFASPALWATGFDVSRIAVVDYRLDGTSGLFLADINNGQPIGMGDGTSFAVFNLLLPNGQSVPFGKSRSSPATDRQGHIYVGTDADYTAVDPTPNATLPVLACVDDLKLVKWALSLGEERVTAVGSASPVVTQGPRGDNRVYMVSSDGVQTITESPLGLTCPTNNPLFDCSGHGVCDCAEAVCQCAACWSGAGTDASCNTYDPSVCQNGATCSPDGFCQCSNACFLGALCDTPKDCKNGGSCNPTDGSCNCVGCLTTNPEGLCTVPTPSLCNNQQCNADGSCTCPVSSCFTGPTCAAPLDCLNGASCSAGTGCQCANCWQTGSDGLCSQPVDCGPGGTCSSSTGQCQCAPCWALGSDAKCSVQVNCNGHGTCRVDWNGGCACQSGYGNASSCAACDACHTGSSCTTPTDATTCTGHGVCTTAPDGSFAGCVCSGGYSGTDCSTAPAAAGGVSTASAAAAGVLVPLAAAGLLVWGLKTAAPGQPLLQAARTVWGHLTGAGSSGPGKYSFKYGNTGSPVKVSGAAAATGSGSPILQSLAKLAGSGNGSGSGSGGKGGEKVSLLQAARSQAVQSFGTTATSL